jgi:hypothetical protein
MSRRMTRFCLGLILAAICGFLIYVEVEIELGAGHSTSVADFMERTVFRIRLARFSLRDSLVLGSEIAGLMTGCVLMLSGLIRKRSKQ